MRRDLLARRGEATREQRHVLVLLAVAQDAPARVVEVLPPPAGIRADRLQVPVRVRADPDISPRRWDHQIPDALHLDGVVDPRAVLVEVDEPAPAAPARPPRRCRRGMTKPHHCPSRGVR
jgi:hypothetical protein